MAEPASSSKDLKKEIKELSQHSMFSNMMAEQASSQRDKMVRSTSEEGLNEVQQFPMTQLQRSASDEVLNEVQRLQITSQSKNRRQSLAQPSITEKGEMRQKRRKRGGGYFKDHKDSVSAEVVLPSKAIKQRKSSETPIFSKINKEGASYRGECLEDVFQDEIIKAFPDITGFKRFARSKNGLCLDEHVIQHIVHSGSGEERRLQILQKWRENQEEKVTVEMICHLLRRYLKGYISLDEGRFGLYRDQILCEQGLVYFGVQMSKVTGSYFCAIKLKPENKNTLKEAQILSKLRNHVNVVSILHAGIYRSGMFDYIFIAMELSWTYTVRNMLEDSDRLAIPFNEFISMNLVKQILSALKFIHSNNIVHRDLKPENVLLSKDWSQSKVKNFGFSETVIDGYCAPEAYNTNAKISSKSDIFSAGVTIAEISSNGRHPFGEDSYLQSHNIISNKNPDLSHLLVFRIMNLIEQMLEMDPEKRPTADEALNEVQHYQTSSQPKNQQTTVDQSSATASLAQLQCLTAEEVLDEVQKFQILSQPKNQQTTADQSTATSPMTKPQRPTAEEVLNEVQRCQILSQPENQQTTADQSSATASMAQLSITGKANAIIMFNWEDKHLYSYKLSTRKWTRMQKCNIDIYFGTAIVSSSYIYILQHQQVYQLEYGDPTASWKSISSMVEYHGGVPPAAMWNGLIYVSGGSDASRSVERYNVASDQWERICDMNTKRRYPCVVATKDHIYSVGGRGMERERFSSVERFDEKSNQWEFVESLPGSINKASAAVVNNQIYVADHERVLCYNIEKNSWSEINFSNQLPFIKCWDVKILAVNEELYIIGRIRSESSSRTAIYLLEPETKQMTLVETFDGKRMNVLGSLTYSESVEVVLPLKAIKQRKFSKIKKEAASYRRGSQYFNTIDHERLDDVFQDEIIKAFPDTTGFKRFARSKNGLCLDEHVIQQIVEYHEGSGEEQQLKMLQKWAENQGEMATVEITHHLLRRYLEDLDGYISLDGGKFGLYKDHVLCEQGLVYFGVQISKVTGSYFCAIKLKPENKNTLKEAQILSKMRHHANVVSILHAGIYRSGMFDYIFIAMELSWTYTVQNMLEDSDRLAIPFNEFISINLVKQILRALDFIHSSNIVHRDLKPENVLLSKDWSQSKVKNFGFSKTIMDGYSAPEAYNTNAKISSKYDIFSAGVTIAEISSNGKHPFGEDPYLQSHNIISNKNPDLSHLLISRIMNLIERMLEIDSEKRPTAEEVLNEVQHYQTLSQTKNQQTTANQSAATSSMAQLFNTEKGFESVEVVLSLKAMKQQKFPKTPIFSKIKKVAASDQRANAIIMLNMKDQHLYSYKPSTRELTRMQKCNIDIYFGTAIVSGNYMYFLQGRDVFRLEYGDPTASWKRISSMVNEYHGDIPPAAMFNGLIYVCGGSYTSRSVERYNVASDQWERVCDMNIKRLNPCVVATENHIYSIGGGGEEGECFISVERFDEKLNKWEFVESSPRSINEASAAVVKNRIYVADHEGVLCYNIQRDSWSEIYLSHQWPFMRSFKGVKILAVNGELYIIGHIISETSLMKTAIYLLGPETKQMTLVEEFDDRGLNVLVCLYPS